MKRANEKPIEAKLRKGVERLGGLCLKLPAVYFTGIPDRLCLLPGGRLYFVETKSSGKDLSPRQLYVKRQLEGLGFQVFKIDSEAALESFLTMLWRKEKEREFMLNGEKEERPKQAPERAGIIKPDGTRVDELESFYDHRRPLGQRFVVQRPGYEISVEPVRFNDVEPLTPSEEKELAELIKAREEIRRRDLTDDLSPEDFKRYRELFYRA